VKHHERKYYNKTNEVFFTVSTRKSLCTEIRKEEKEMLKSSRRWILSPKLFVSLVSEALRGPTAAFPDERAVFKKKEKERVSFLIIN
jgi:hypothetical protein